MKMKSKTAELAAELSGLTAAPGQTAPAGLDDLFARLRASLTPETAPRLDQLAPRFGGFGVYAEAAAELFGPDAMLAVAARRIPDGVVGAPAFWFRVGLLTEADQARFIHAVIDRFAARARELVAEFARQPAEIAGLRAALDRLKGSPT
jgi:hypothetical protein